jgi:hypothetical protein
MEILVDPHASSLESELRALRADVARVEQTLSVLVTRPRRALSRALEILLIVVVAAQFIGLVVVLAT